jgi:hypothetical protein
MKIRNLSFLFLAVSFLMVSCGEDTCDVLADTVPGTWTVEAAGSGSVTFNADGTMTQTENLIFDSTFDGQPQTWAISGSTIVFASMDNNGTTSIDFAVTTFECDVINATNDGNEFIFRRS